MDQLPVVFQATFSPNNQDRQNAENFLKQMSTQKGFLISLLKLSLTQNIALPIRQASALYFKNALRRNWEIEDGEGKIDVEEKNPIRASIIKAIVQSDMNIRKILTSALKHILKTDYPKLWNPSTECFEYLKQNNPNDIEGSLLCLRVMARRYEFRMVDPKRQNREVVYNMSKNLLPFLVELAKQINLNSSSSEQNARIKVLVLKIFWSCVQFDIPPYLSHDKNNTFAWMDICNKMLTMDLSSLENKQDRSILNLNPLWKAKKWAIKIISRIFSRWGSKEQTKVPEKLFDKETICEDYQYDDISQEEWNQHVKLREMQAGWGEWWTATFSNIFFKTLLNELSGITQNKFLPKYFLHYCVSFVIQAVRLATTWSVLKPNMSIFLNNVLFPLICFSKEDVEMFTEDIDEFLRLEFDLSEMTRNIRLQSMFLLRDVLTLRSRNYLDDFMKFLNIQLQNYSNHPTQFYVQKEGVLSCLGVLSERLKAIPKYEKQIEGMLLKHVYPELSSNNGMVQSKAIWVFTRYYNIAFSKVEVYLEGLQLVLKCMNSKCLSAQVQAATSLKYHLKIEEGADFLSKIVDKLMEKLIEISSKVELEELVLCLSHLIEEFPEKIVPFSCNLIEQFMRNFFSLYESAKEESTGNAASAALAVLENIVLVIKSLNEANVNDDKIYNKINHLATQFLIKNLKEEVAFEYISEAIAIFTSSTFSTVQLDPYVFNVIEPLYSAYKSFLPDLFIDFLPVWDNLISKLPEVFLQNKTMVGYFTEMVETKMKDLDADELECGAACQMIEVIFLNCKGKADHFLEPFLFLSLNRLSKYECKSDELKSLLFQNILNAIYYNAGATIQYLGKSNSMSFVVEGIFSLIPQFNSLHQKKTFHPLHVFSSSITS
eukprot:TRINITY_DN5258_c0_g1_i1.p1 TRINITY_DN5258_c0_g1~~TRINITY_DN5258_c0_g1_i1.p1  ORF type:complete len:885 (+),score=267.42 TRINITY_DN5258_c0_g1_i1:228-2882(+)